MKLLITGDLAITKPYNASVLIDQSVKDLFALSNLNIVNLETPITYSNSKILKTGPNLKAHRQSIKEIFKVLNVKVATLANNHLMDYDEKGVADTLAFCKEEKVQTVGGGMNLEEASKTLYLDTEEGKIAVVNFAENEWIAATPTSAGFNPMDIIDNTRQIQDASKNADYVIVVIHGGHEYYNLPSPRMVKQYRYYAEQGADIVVGHHTHCISGNEEYKGVPIYYSLANFLFNQNSCYEDWYTGLVLEVNIKNKKLTTSLHPVVQEKDTFSLSLKLGKEKTEILDRVKEFNLTIIDKNKLIKEWEFFLNRRFKSYLSEWSPISFIEMKLIYKVLNKLNFNFLNKKGIAINLSLIQCEAHLDASLSILKKYLNKYDK